MTYYAIAILAQYNNKIMLDFLEEMYDYFKEKKLNYDIYLIIDNEDKKERKNKKIKIIQIDNRESSKNGYKNSLLRYYHRKDIRKVSLALDKSLYYFNKICPKKYDYYWLLEEDVFIPTVKTIPYIDKKYPDGDLLTEGNTEKKDEKMEWHWPLMVRNNRNRESKLRLKKASESNDYYLPLPWYYSFNPGIRISYKLLESIGEFVKKNNTLIFMEFMFNTIAMHNNLKVVKNENIKIRYDHDRSKKVWKINEIRYKNLYTSIKSFEEQKEFRSKI